MPSPHCDRLSATSLSLDGPIAAYLRGVTAQWLLVAPEANPAMLEMLHDRDRQPFREMVPWAGEFAGKYLTGAVQVLRVTGDPALKAYLQGYVDELVALQAADGYLGPWPAFARVTNQVPYSATRLHYTWDTWGHYHATLGLLLWHATTGDARALQCAARIGDLLCDKYLGAGKPSLAETGSTEMNLAPAHSLCLLYNATGTQRYLDLARQIVEVEFGWRDANGNAVAGDYVETALQGQAFFETPRPRWESLHPIMGIVELYYLTGEENYRRAFEHIWWSICKLDRHNNGGFSSGEQAQGNPYHPGAIETCCTIAWTALTVEMLRLTRDARVADELELSTLNSIVGMHSYTGRWATYNTPMDGVRRASAHEIVFQSREGTPELNCCSVNSARGFGMLSDWALMGDADGLVLNWYGPGTYAATLPSGVRVSLLQETTYPRDGRVVIRVSPEAPAAFTLKLRIPRWSAATGMTVNGEAVAAEAGSYLALARAWQAGDTIELDLDMTVHGWVGDKECANKASLYRGPLLLAYDRRFNAMDPEQLPALDAQTLGAGRIVHWTSRLPPILLMEFMAVDGQLVRLCDFGSAGEGGTPYRSWLWLQQAETMLPQYFATTAEELFVADLARLSASYTKQSLAQQQWMMDHEPEKALAWFEAQIGQYPQLVALCAQVRDLLARDPASPLAQAARPRYEALAAAGVFSPTYLDDFKRGRKQFLAEHPELKQRVTQFEASPLQPVVEDIRVAPFPGPLAFAPVPYVWETELADIRGVHQGQHGLIYLQASVEVPWSGPSVLSFGADGPVKAWVNGSEAGCEPSAAIPAVLGEYQYPVVLHEGTNVLTFAISSDHGKSWGVVVRVGRRREAAVV
jgi:DUF1680 family protein